MAGRIDAFYGQRPNLKEFAPEGIFGELARLYYDTANATSAPTMAALLKLVKSSQITYGTDYPYFPLDQVNDLRKLGLAAADLTATRRVGPFFVADNPHALPRAWVLHRTATAPPTEKLLP